MNWSSWMEPERSISEEKNTVWKVLGERVILPMTLHTHNPPDLAQCLLELLEVNGPAFIRIKVVEGTLRHHRKHKKGTFHFHTSSSRDLNSSKPSCPLRS